MTCELLTEVGLPSLCLLQQVEVVSIVLFLPVMLVKFRQLWQASYRSEKSATLSTFALLCRTLAFYTSVVVGLVWVCRGGAFAVAFGLANFVVAALHYAEYEIYPSRVALTELLLWWTLQAPIQLSRLAVDPSKTNVLLFVLSGSVWVLEMASSPQHPTDFEDSTVFGKINMGFVEDMIKVAEKESLTQSKFAGHPDILTTNASYIDFDKEMSSFDESNNNRVIWSLILFRRWHLAFMIFLDLFGDFVSYTRPLFLSFFLRSLQQLKDNPRDWHASAYFGLALGLIKLAESSVSGLQELTSSIIFGASRGALSEAIYLKSLIMAPKTRGVYDSAKIMNLMNVDTAMVMRAYQQFSTLIAAPIGLIICTLQLYFFMGNSTLAAIPFYALYAPFSSWASKRMMKRFPETMQAKDKRAKATMSVMRNMKSLKLYAWEDPYEARVIDARQEELGIQKKYLKVQIFFFTITHQLENFAISAVIIAFLYFTNQPLTPEIVFPTLSMLSLVSEPLFSLPRSITELGRAFTAQTRLHEFFLQPNQKNDNYYREAPVDENDFDTPLVSLKNAAIAWDESVSAIEPLTLSLTRGEMCCILGKVGSGKSALLKSMVGQMSINGGSLTLKGRLAYASQDPWLQYRSLKDNILFGLKYDEAFYKKTIESCDLLSDIKSFPDGDATEIGEKGISLSGGQKARVALARAVYSQADIVILDDVLSAVDQHVSKKLLTSLFSPTGLLAGKTIILATHTVGALTFASKLVCLSPSGKILYNGEPARANADVLVSAIGDLSDSGGQKLFEDVLSSSGASRKQDVLKGIKESTKFEDPEFDPNNPNSAYVPENYSKDEMFPDVPIFHVFKRYLQTANPKLALVALGAMASSILFVNLVSVWLTVWSNKQLSGLKSSEFYVIVYLCIVLGTVVSVFGANYMFVGTIALRTSQRMHDSMLVNVAHAPMSFFERTPLGTIMNRFTGDIDTLDGTFPTMLYSFMRSLWMTFITLGIAIAGAPLIIVILVPLLFKYNTYRRKFIPVSRQLQKLSSAARGPMLSHVEESVRGVATVSAFDARDPFIIGFEKRSDYFTHASFFRSALRRWLEYRIATMTAILITTSALSLILLIGKSSLPVSIAGMVLYSIQLASSRLGWIISSWTDLEISVVAVERMFAYMDQPTEAPYRLSDEEQARLNLNPSWPSEGYIEFQNYSTRFRPNLPNALNDITLSISKQEKIGVVGRTGAGKSTLTLSLFRLLEAVSGKITIDDRVTSELGLFDLRSRLSIIPQDAQIFKGSLRENLDPLGTSDDARLWRILELCHLKDQFEQGLDVQLSEGGENISRGQSQLICLGRALLRPTSILVLDEATASVDNNTDSFVQTTIREEFKDRTIITVAHRLNTIMDSDRILVLGDGQVLEFDSPKKLLEKRGAFYELARSHDEL